MVSLVILVTVLFTVAVALICSARWRRRLPMIGASALALGVLIFAFFLFGPKDYLVRWPSLSSWLHPFQLVWYSAILCLFGGAILLGLAARRIFGR